jgi:CRP-like cAMP-binding protein
MFFILDGAAQVVSADGKTVFAELATNAFFGEVSLFYQTNRTANVRARLHTTVLEISKDALFSVVEQHPELKEVMLAKAKENYELFLKRQQGLSTLKKTPSDVGEEFDLDATVERLRKVAYFETCQIGFLKNLALTTSVRRYKKAELIVKKGDISKEMFFVVDGQVDIISETGQVFDSVIQGGFFGEVGIIKAVQRTASVRVSSELCTVIVLTGDSLKKFVSEYPDSFQSIAFECEKRLRKIEERREISLSSSMNRSSGTSEPVISTAEVGKIMSQGSVIHTSDEFTDAIKLNKKERNTITHIFRSRESSRDSRQQSVTASEMQDEKHSNQTAADNAVETASLDSIQDPEPKKGMKISEQAPVVEKKAPEAAEKV